MENLEKPQTVKSAKLVETIWHVAGITVLLNMTDEEIANTFQVSLLTLADWKQQPEWKEGSAAFAKVELDPRTMKFLKKGTFARQIMLDSIGYTRRFEAIRPRYDSATERFLHARVMSRMLTAHWVRKDPASRSFIERWSDCWGTTERVPCKATKKRPKVLSYAKKSAMQRK